MDSLSYLIVYSGGILFGLAYIKSIPTYQQRLGLIPRVYHGFNNISDQKYIYSVSSNNIDILSHLTISSDDKLINHEWILNILPTYIDFSHANKIKIDPAITDIPSTYIVHGNLDAHRFLREPMNSISKQDKYIEFFNKYIREQPILKPILPPKSTYHITNTPLHFHKQEQYNVLLYGSHIDNKFVIEGIGSNNAKSLINTVLPNPSKSLFMCASGLMCIGTSIALFGW